MTAPLGVICAAGMMPLRIADAAAKSGREVFCILLEGVARPEDFARFPHEVVRVGAVGRILGALRARGIGELVLTGRMARPSLRSVGLDADGLRLAAKLGARAVFGGDDSFLSAIIRVLAEEGFRVVGAQEVMNELLVDAGVPTTAQPDSTARADIARGILVVKALGAVDVGQACVVQQGLVLGVEGIEGTDALLARCGGLRREGPGGVLVKMVKPSQSSAIDLPVIGPETVRAAAAAGLSGIAIEARQGQTGTLMVDRAATLEAAAAAGLFIAALHPAEFLQSEGATT